MFTKENTEGWTDEQLSAMNSALSQIGDFDAASDSVYDAASSLLGDGRDVTHDNLMREMN